MKVLAYHGTDRCDFSRFDMKRAEPFNIGLHFGTKAAALARIAYLRENGRAASMRPPSIPNLATLQRRFDRLSDRWMSVDDDPRFQKDPSLYDAYNRKASRHNGREQRPLRERPHRENRCG